MLISRITSQWTLGAMKSPLAALLMVLLTCFIAFGQLAVADSSYNICNSFEARKLSGLAYRDFLTTYVAPSPFPLALPLI